MFLFENRQRRKYERTVDKAELHPGTLLVMRWDTCAGGCVLLCCWSWHFWAWTVRTHSAESSSALLSVCEPFIRDLPGQMKSTAHGKSLPNVNPIFMCLGSAFLAAFLPFCLLSRAFVEDVGNGIGSTAAPHGCWTPVSEGGDTGCLGSAGLRGWLWRALGTKPDVSSVARCSEELCAVSHPLQIYRLWSCWKM